MDFSEIKRIFADESEKLGITEYEIYYVSGSSVSTETLKDDISSFSSGVHRGICFRCADGGKIGYASSEFFEENELRSLVSRAAENAKIIEKTGDVIFAGSKEYAKLPERKAHEPMGAAELKKTALEIQKKMYDRDSGVTDGTQSYAMSEFSELRIVNSHGLDLCRSAGINAVYAIPVIKDGEESQSDYELARLDEKIDIDGLVTKALNKTREKFCAKSIPSGKYNVVMDSEQMRSLLSVFSSAFYAKQAQNGLSVLAGKEGEKIAADIITITDDPMREGNHFITNFDAEGVAAYKKTVVDSGVLKTLLYNLESAKKAGVESTGNASKGGYNAPVGTSAYAFCIEKGDLTFGELLNLAGNGILITELKGLHAGADPVTGDFSLESAGFMLENGKKTFAVKNFTLAGNFFELLKSVKALSDEVDIGPIGGYTVFGSPAALFENMSVAGE